MNPLNVHAETSRAASVANCLGLLELGTKEPESPDYRRATAEHLRQCKDAP